MSTWAFQRSRNPFHLTNRQADAVALLVELGTDKAVAARLGITEESTCRRLCEAQRTMGASSRVHLALMWDRAHRQAGVTKHRGVGL